MFRCDRFSVRKSIFLSMLSLSHFGSPLRRPKRRSRGLLALPRAPQEAPRGPQKRPRRLREGLKSTPGSSKRVSRGRQNVLSMLYLSVALSALHVHTFCWRGFASICALVLHKSIDRLDQATVMSAVLFINVLLQVVLQTYELVSLSYMVCGICKASRERMGIKIRLQAADMNGSISLNQHTIT